MKARVIAFEGLDGAGKSTVIAEVAAGLEARGHTVHMPRVGKEHASRPTRMIRRLARDHRNLLLCPRAELGLYCAREAQVLEEDVRPALAAGKVVLLDRSLLTPIVLGSYGRGLPLEECQRAAELAAGGLWPDETVILDVHPRTSRIRKRLAKVHAQAKPDPGRKGLSGSALKERIGAGYREVAAQRGYPLFHTERVGPDTVAQRVAAYLFEGVRPEDVESPLDGRPAWHVDAALDFEEALERVHGDLAVFMTRGLIAGRARRAAAADQNPALVAWSLDAEDPLRDTLAQTQAKHALAGWRRRPLDGPEDLRLRALEWAPEEALRAMTHLVGGAADEARERLADAHPSAVLASLAGRDDPMAWALRERLWSEGDTVDRALSLTRCVDERAWPLRDKLFAKAPIYGLQSLRGLNEARAADLMQTYAEAAPKIVLRAIRGEAAPFAHALRERLLETGREVMDSLGALEDPASMALRESVVERWPSSVVGSLARVEDSPAVDALVERAKVAGAGDLHLLRRLAARGERDRLPAWRRREEEEGDA